MNEPETAVDAVEMVSSRWSVAPIGDGAGWLVIAVGVLLLLLTWLRPTGVGNRLTPRRIWTLRGLRVAAILAILVPMMRPAWIFATRRDRPASFVILVDGSRSMTVPDGENGVTRWETTRRILDRLTTDLGPMVAGDAANVNSEKETEPGETAKPSGTVRIYRFDESLTPVTGVLPETPDGEMTAIGVALDSLARRESERRLVGVLMISDGAQRAIPPHQLLPQVAAARLAARGIVVDAVPVGSAAGGESGRDLSVGEFVAPDQVFAKHEIEIAAVLRQRGFSGTGIEAELIAERFTENGRNTEDATEVVGRQRVTLSNAETLPVRFYWRPEKAGCYRLTLRVPPQPGEVDPKNNEVVTFLDVLDGGVRVLYMEGFPPRTEQKFIVRALASSPEIDLAVVHLRDPRDGDGGAGGRGGDVGAGGALSARRPLEMVERLKPDGCNVILFGDLAAACMTSSEMERMARLVSDGAGIGFLGGFHTFGPGGYADTPLAPLMPVTMQAIERMRPGEAPSPTAHLTDPLTLRPVASAAGHPLLAIGTEDGKNAADDKNDGNADGKNAAGAEDIAKLWAALPALDGANRWDAATLKPAAQRILESPRGDPMLVSQPYGRGRVWGFAGDSTWLWAMQGAERTHTRFWRQMVLWLAGQSGWSEDPIRLRVPRRQIVRGSRPELTVTLRIPDDVPGGGENIRPEYIAESLNGRTKYAAVAMTAQLVALDGSRMPIELVREGNNGDRNDSTEADARNAGSVKNPPDTAEKNNERGGIPVWRGVLPDALPDGDYRIEVVGQDGDREIGRCSTWVVSRFRDLEMEHAVADPGLLEQIATTTGGRLVMPEEVLPRLRERLARMAEKSQILVERRVTLWDHWGWLALVTSLLGTEWALRRRWGIF